MVPFASPIVQIKTVVAAAAAAAAATMLRFRFRLTVSRRSMVLWYQWTQCTGMWTVWDCLVVSVQYGMVPYSTPTLLCRGLGKCECHSQADAFFCDGPLVTLFSGWYNVACGGPVVVWYMCVCMFCWPRESVNNFSALDVSFSREEGCEPRWWCCSCHITVQEKEVVL
jgi:hypothetical protein